MQKPPVYIGSEVYRQSSFGHNHPLSYARQESVLDMVRVLGWLPEQMFLTSSQADIDTLTQFHNSDYVQALKRADGEGKARVSDRENYNFGTMENPLFKGVFKRASTTIGGSILAAQTTMGGGTVFHPSGGTHHGRADKASGFCYFNDPVFAIREFLSAGLERILYVDIDAHHGDGVEAAFADEERVHVLSIHEENRWPYSGTMDDQKSGQINIPVPHGLNDTEFEYIFSHVVMPYCAHYQPQAIVITCGADGLKDDPLSKMELSNKALWDAVLKLRGVSKRCVVLGGGGYNPWTTIRCWVGLWAKLAGFDVPDVLPNAAQDILSKFDSDLIDEEDRLPGWITTLEDPSHDGDVREEIIVRVRALVDCHLQ